MQSIRVHARRTVDWIEEREGKNEVSEYGVAITEQKEREREWSFRVAFNSKRARAEPKTEAFFFSLLFSFFGLD